MAKKKSKKMSFENRSFLKIALVLGIIAFAFTLAFLDGFSKPAEKKFDYSKSYVITDLTGIELTPLDELFAVSIAVPPVININDYRLTVNGLVDRELSLSYDEIKALPAESEIVVVECVDNPPGGNLIGTVNWTGVPLKTVLEQAGVKSAVKEVVFYSADGYSTSVELQYALRDEVMLAYGANSQVLPANQGYPLRLVSPGKYGYKWPKWITRIELIDYDYAGYWESRGWSDDANRQ